MGEHSKSCSARKTDFKCLSLAAHLVTDTWDGIANEAVRYFKDIFTSNGTGGSIDDELIDRCLSPEEAESLSQTYTADEVQIQAASPYEITRVLFTACTFYSEILAW